MKKLLILVIICMSSCMVPYSSYDYVEPTRYMYYPMYQPTKIIVNQKPHKHNKRHVKVKINRHRKNGRNR